MLRDEKGNWICGFQCNLGRGGILEAELWGILHGCKLAISAGCEEVDLESDSAEAVELILRGDLIYHPLANLVSDCRRIIEMTPNFSLKAARRSANEVADHLAKLSFNEDIGLKTLRDPPTSAFVFLQKDCNFNSGLNFSFEEQAHLFMS